jgi:hypothetical protein
MTPVTNDNTKIISQSFESQAWRHGRFFLSLQIQGFGQLAVFLRGGDVNRVKNFNLVMNTDFRDIEFPSETPLADLEGANRRGLDPGVELHQSDFRIPNRHGNAEKDQPGAPWPAQISFFAPISLAFFFVWMFVITLLRRIDPAPMNYLFLGCRLFRLPLLFAYLVDHLDLMASFAIASCVSVFLVVSYLRLVVGMRFAAWRPV